MSELQAGWAVVTTRSMAEEVAAKRLRSIGWRVYLPVGRKLLRGIRLCPKTGRRIRTRGSGEIVMRPIFTGYLFTELHPGQQWSSILQQPGVIGMLGSHSVEGMRPKLMTDRGIEALRQAEREGEFDELRCRRGKISMRPDLAVGATVAVEVAGIRLEGVIDEMSDKGDQAIVRYMLFGRQSRTEVRTSILELVAA